MAQAHILDAMISIHALLTESDRRHFRQHCPAVAISIHALLTESDDGVGLLEDVLWISIHALLTESDLSVLYIPQVGP